MKQTETVVLEHYKRILTLPDPWQGQLKDKNLKVGRAFAMKEQFRRFWDFRNSQYAEGFYRRWYFWATHSRLKPMIEAARTIDRHYTNISNYFRHRITNAVAEGLNSKIQLIKAGAR